MALLDRWRMANGKFWTWMSRGLIAEEFKQFERTSWEYISPGSDKRHFQVGYIYTHLNIWLNKHWARIVLDGNTLGNSWRCKHGLGYQGERTVGSEPHTDGRIMTLFISRWSISKHHQRVKNGLLKRLLQLEKIEKLSFVLLCHLSNLVPNFFYSFLFSIVKSLEMNLKGLIK